MSAVNTFNFNGLPFVVQTEVAKCLPFQDLVDGSSVSKVFKRVVENNQAWSIIASQRFLSMTKNIKNHLREEQAKIIHQAILSLMSQCKIWTEDDWKAIAGEADPFARRDKIIEIFGKKSAYERNYENKVIPFLLRQTALTQFPCGEEIEAVKALLKGGMDLFLNVEDTETLQNYIVFAGNLDEGIFKAYIEGKKKHWSSNKENLFEKEIALALEKYSPAFLKLLLQEQCQTLDNIAQVILCLTNANVAQVNAAEEMWKLITAKYQKDPESLKVFQEVRAHCNACKIQGGTVELQTIIDNLNKKLRKK